MKPLDLSFYLVLDPTLCGGAQGMLETALAAAASGATVVQLRAPDWKKQAVAELARALVARLPARVPLIVNDHADVAAVTKAAGVHVGQKDLSAEDCRALLGPYAYVGLSISNTEELARASHAADHFGFGPVFATQTKKDAAPALGLDGLRELVRRADRPAVAIGGITACNASDVRACGVSGIAVVSAVCGTTDPAESTRALACPSEAH